MTSGGWFLIIVKFAIQIVAYVVCYNLLLILFKITHGKPGLSNGITADYTLYFIILFAALQSVFSKFLAFKNSYWFFVTAFIFFQSLLFGFNKFNFLTIIPATFLSSILAMTVNLIGESKPYRKPIK